MNVKFVNVPLHSVAEYFAKDFYSEHKDKEVVYNRFYIDGSQMVFVLEEIDKNESVEEAKLD